MPLTERTWTTADSDAIRNARTQDEREEAIEGAVDALLPIVTADNPNVFTDTTPHTEEEVEPFDEATGPMEPRPYMRGIVREEDVDTDKTHDDPTE